MLCIPVWKKRALVVEKIYVYALLCCGCFKEEMLLLYVSAVVVMKKRCVVKKRCNAMHVSVVLFFLISAVFFLICQGCQCE
jgi:hypothetical protein